MTNPFIKLEDEILLRRAVRSVYQNEGYEGIIRSLGETSRLMQIVLETYKEIIEEEAKG